MIFNMAGGGGGNDTIYAALIVYIDTGSTITVTDGVSTFTGTSVNGECTFDRLTPATWTVTATNGVDTVAGAVVVTNSALIDGYPDPLISTLELTYRDNTIVAVFWGVSNSSSYEVPTRSQSRLADSEYFTFPQASNGYYTAPSYYNNSDVALYKNGTSIATATFDNATSVSTSVETSFVAGDQFGLKIRGQTYVSGGFIVEVV